jgi:outer membrane biosynthesis protein TonB
MEMPTRANTIAIRKATDDPLSIGAGVLGTFMVHAVGVIAALYFSRQPKPEFPKPERTIVMTELAKLGGGGMLPKEYMPTKAVPTPDVPKNAMADPTKPTEDKPTPQETDNKPTNQKPSLEDLIKKNANAKESNTEGQGEGDAPPGPGQADGSANGTADKGGRKGWEAEAGSYLKKYWSRANTIPESECAQLTTEIRIKLDDTLHIESCDITKSSGNDIFDSSVCPAVGKLRDEKSSFPEPPASMNLNLAGQKLKIGFRCAAIE